MNRFATNHKQAITNDESGVGERHLADGPCRALPPPWDASVKIAHLIVPLNALLILAIFRTYSDSTFGDYYERQEKCALDNIDQYDFFRIPYYVEWIFTNALFYSNDTGLKRISYDIHALLQFSVRHPTTVEGDYHIEMVGDVRQDFIRNIRQLVELLFRRCAEIDTTIDRLITAGHHDTMVQMILNCTFFEDDLLESENTLRLFDYIFETEGMTSLENHHRVL
jgi:hypothetical protein